MSEERNIQSEVYEIKQRAIKKALYESFCKVYKKEINDDPQQFIDDYFHGLQGYETDIGKISNQQTSIYTSNKKLRDDQVVALMVTFSPDPEHEMGYLDLDKLALKICKPGKGLLESYYTIEQRGVNNEEVGLGGHFHAVLILNKKEQMGQPARQTRRIMQALEKYRTTTPRFLDIKRVSQNKLQDKIDYVTGQKEDSDKIDKLEFDRIWREDYNAPLFRKL